MQRRGRVQNNRKQHARVEALELHELKVDEIISGAPPPPLRFPLSMRYQFASTSNSTINAVSLFNLLGYSTSTTAVQTLVESVKIRAIHVWIPGSVQTAATGFAAPSCAISVQDMGVLGAGLRRDTTIVSSGGKPAYFCYRPKGIFAEWMGNEVVDSTVDAPIMTLVPVGCFPFVQLDCSVQLITSFGASGTGGFTQTVDATTANRLGFFYLDSTGTISVEGTQILKPVGFFSFTVNEPKPLATGGGPVVSSSSRLAPVCRFRRN